MNRTVLTLASTLLVLGTLVVIAVAKQDPSDPQRLMSKTLILETNLQVPPGVWTPTRSLVADGFNTVAFHYSRLDSLAGSGSLIVTPQWRNFSQENFENHAVLGRGDPRYGPFFQFYTAHFDHNLLSSASEGAHGAIPVIGTKI